MEAGVGMKEDWRWLQIIRQLLQMTVLGLQQDRERRKGTWVKVCKGSRLINKYDPYYIELSNTYSLLE